MEARDQSVGLCKDNVVLEQGTETNKINVNGFRKCFGGIFGRRS